MKFPVLPRLRHAVVDEERVAGVPQVLAQFLVEPGGHRLGRVALGAAEDGDGAEGDAHGEEAVHDLREHLLHARVGHRGRVERVVGERGALLEAIV